MIQFSSGEIDVSQPVFELPAQTPRAEARTAVALANYLIDCGIPVREIAIAVPAADQYIPALPQAGRRWDLPVTVWTQLPLTDTSPYRLCKALTTVLDADTTAVAAENLLTPLEAGWVPEDPAATQTWPISPETVIQWRHSAPDEPRPLSDWQSNPDWHNDDPRVRTYVEWLAAQPTAPSPATAADVITNLLASYKESVVPLIEENDAPTYEQTIQVARAVARLEELVPRLTEKYDAWLDASRMPRRWKTVGRLLELFATQVPGRREHANARAIDVLEVSDLWERSYEYVIALGLTEGMWPLRNTCVLPVALREEIIHGSEEVSSVVPRMSWFNYQEWDMFIETVTAAEAAAFLMYHTTDQNQTECEPSPFLNTVTTTRCEPATVKTIQDPDASLPGELAAVIESRVEGANE